MDLFFKDFQGSVAIMILYAMATWEPTQQMMENCTSKEHKRNGTGVTGSSYIFLGLLFFKTVEDDVETARQNALVLRRASHCVSLAGVCHAVCKQQSYATQTLAIRTTCCTAQH